MGTEDTKSCTAFEGNRCIASGDLVMVALKVKEHSEGRETSILIFDDFTSEAVEVDLRGTRDDVRKRLETPPGASESVAPQHAGQGQPRGPGRPRLGVVSREVTLLPRHWDWLAGQPGGASVALRKLVEEARRSSGDRDARRQAQEAAHRFLSALAGNLPGYEEALRALFAGERERFAALVGSWPADVRDHAQRLAERAFPRPGL
jgi:hypothetical protein